MMRSIAILLFAIFLCGCQTLKIAATPKIEPEGSDMGFVAFLNNPDKITKFPIPAEHEQSVAAACGVKYSPLLNAVLWVPVVAKLVFDLGADQFVDYIEGIKKRSSADYNARLEASVSDFVADRCVVAGRVKERDDGTLEYESLVVAKLFQSTGNSESVVLRPVYALAKNSIALTKCDENCFGKNQSRQGKIGISIAIVVNGVTLDSTSVNEVRRYGSAVVSFPEIPLNGSGILIDEPISMGIVQVSPIDSEIMPAKLPGSKLQLSVTVTETGTVGGNFDRAASEIEALKGALGPAIEAQVTTRYKDE
jgi:hypothetical protein